jgi:hypothetical protein
MTKSEEFYHEIIAQLPEAIPSKMFGALCAKTINGKAAVMYWKEAMVFKLTGEDESEALALDGASVFSPADGRKMNGWILIPYDYKDKWLYFAEKSVDFVKNLKK